MRSVLTVSLALVLVGVVPAWAHASPSTATVAAFAASTWDEFPCEGRETVRWADFRDVPGLENDANAYGATDVEGCAIYLNVLQRMTTLRLCTVLRHEYGHLAGLTHSDDPFDLMYPNQNPSLRDDGEADMVRRNGRFVYVPAYDAQCKAQYPRLRIASRPRA